MSFKRVSPKEACELMDRDGYVYVDVRSIPEFEAGHPESAYNVPLLHMGAHGMSPNPEFLDVMQRNFAKDTKLVVGCKAGGRSLQAATLLTSSGFTSVVDQRAGYEGGAGPTGVPEPGWRPQGLPVSTQAGAGHSYEDLKTKSR
jgi:rhodanese-related sulfurtransferase